MFSSKDLKNMIVPLFLEQLLLMLVGIVDTFNIAYCGEAAVSGFRSGKLEREYFLDADSDHSNGRRIPMWVPPGSADGI